MNTKTTELENVVIRFVGDSGDGMQLTGNEFTKAAAIAGNDISTFPDFPAEIRAPAGSLAGVSGFQLHFSSSTIHTPGDAPNVLVVMNPAAFKTNIADLTDNGILIVNTGTFTEINLKKAGYTENPLDDDKLPLKYQLHAIDITALTMAALADTDLSTKEKGRAKNFFALGLLFWVYSREPEREVEQINDKFAKKSKRLADANIKVFKTGYHYGETAEVFQSVYEVKPAKFKPGIYRNITGNEALALGFVAAATKAGKPLVYSGYPITPASSLLHSLSNYKHFGVTTFQAEDEIASMSAAVGAAYGGAIAVTASSGPGIALKGEAIGLATITELPVVIVNVQRGGPSTGLPTKTEQSDLFQSIYGRNGDCPLPIISVKTPGDAFYVAFEAVRIATKYMIPVLLLSDGYLANGAEPWLVPDVDALPDIEIEYRTDPEGYQVYARDENLARAWVIPGTPGLEHRIGGLEKDFYSGNVSYDPENHEAMTRMRAARVRLITQEMGPLDLCGDEAGDVLVLGWGGTYGALRQAVEGMRDKGKHVTHCHLRWLFPFNPRLDDLVKNFKHILVPELNNGQLRTVLRATYLLDVVGLNKIQGKPFQVREIISAIVALLDDKTSPARTAHPIA